MEKDLVSQSTFDALITPQSTKRTAIRHGIQAQRERGNQNSGKERNIGKNSWPQILKCKMLGFPKGVKHEEGGFGFDTVEAMLLTSGVIEWHPTSRSFQRGRWKSESM